MALVEIGTLSLKEMAKRAANEEYLNTFLRCIGCLSYADAIPFISYLLEKGIYFTTFFGVAHSFRKRHHLGVLVGAPAAHDCGHVGWCRYICLPHQQDSLDAPLPSQNGLRSGFIGTKRWKQFRQKFCDCSAASVFFAQSHRRREILKHDSDLFDVYLHPQPRVRESCTSQETGQD
jgi:hypothetical protein